MNRFVAVAACGLLLAGCEAMMQLPSFGGKESEQISLKLETDPPGAEAKLSTGASCVTPCALPVAGGADVTVNFSLARYQPHSVTARAVAAEKNFVGMESAPARFEPNPVYAELQPALRERKPKPPRDNTVAKPPSTQTGDATAPAVVPAQPSQTPPAAPEPAPAAAPAPAPPSEPAPAASPR